MSEKVTIEPKYIGDFVGALGIFACGEYRAQAGKNPRKKLGKKEEEEMRAAADIMSIAIAKGLILAKHQPELSDAFVKHMNEHRPGYADKLLSDMLFHYEHFVYKIYHEQGWRPPGAP